MSSGSCGLQCRKNTTHPTSPFSTEDRSFLLDNKALCNLICCLEFSTYPDVLIPSSVYLKQAYQRVHFTQRYSVRHSCYSIGVSRSRQTDKEVYLSRQPHQTNNLEKRLVPASPVQCTFIRVLAGCAGFFWDCHPILSRGSMDYCCT